MSLSKIVKPHICFVAPSLYPILADDRSSNVAGGAEAQQRFVIKGLQGRGYLVTVVTDDFGQPDQVNIDGIRIIKIKRKNRGLPFIRFFHPGITSLWKAMSRANADVYYQRAAGWPTGAVGIFCRYHRRKFIYSVAHDLDLIKDRTKELFDFPMAWRAQLLYEVGLKCADVTVTQTAVQQELCRKWHAKESVRIVSGYSPISKLEPGSGRDAVLWVAALRRWKRPELFLELARRLPAQRFRMIGGPAPGEDGLTFYREVETEARSIRNLEFLGFQPPAVADAYFDKATVFVNTSDTEGFPNTFLQAWARGVPTISFINCGAQDQNGALGGVVSSMDDMVDTLDRLMADKPRRALEGERCRHYFEQYHSVNAVVDQYDRLLLGLMTASDQ